jgi:putative transposase
MDISRKNRHSIRLTGYDYSRVGLYFVTLVVYQRENLFGAINTAEMELNEMGRMAVDSWTWLADQYPYVGLDQYCLMPNHFHGILVIKNDGGGASVPGKGDAWSGAGGAWSGTGGSRTAPTQGTPIKPLGRLIGAFKTVSTKKINLCRQTPAMVVWQRNYYEHIIRNEKDLERIRQYINNNPANWLNDEENRRGGS